MIHLILVIKKSLKKLIAKYNAQIAANDIEIAKLHKLKEIVEKALEQLDKK